MRRFLILGITTLFVCGTSVHARPPRNVIFLIGDGMGFEQLKAAGMYANGEPNSLIFESFPHRAEATTYSADSAVTDSAAAATAIATGHKVNNRVVSVSILADTCAMADGLATAIMVMGPEKGQTLLNRLDAVEGLIVTANPGHDLKEYPSKKFEESLRKQ